MKLIAKIITNQYLLLFLIICLAFMLRMYKVDSPIADWHSWRQADTAAVSRNFFKEGFTPFIPKYDDMSANSETWRSNPSRYRFVEFPIYNTVVYWGYLLNNGVDERIARLVSVVFATFTIPFLFLLVKRYFDGYTALLATFFYAALPFSVYYGRTTLPEPTLVFFCIGMVYFVDRWIFENKWWLYILSLIFISCSLLIKPVAIFYMIVFSYSFWRKEGKLWPIPARYWFLFLPAFLPLIGWRVWMLNFPEGIPMSNWLFNGNKIRLRPAYWYWIVGQRLGEVILGVGGVVLLMFGSLFRASRKETYFWHFALVGMMGYLLVIATGNVQHDYYQYLTVPVLSVFAARGLVILNTRKDIFIGKFWIISVSIVLLFLTIYLPWVEVKGYYQINNGAMVEAGKAADRLLPKDAVVVAPYNGDSAFLYQTNRIGFALLIGDIEDMKHKYGVGYYISTAEDHQTKSLMEEYSVLEKTDKYVIIDVRGQKSK